MGQEQFDLQARRADASPAQKIGAALNDIQNGHAPENKFKLESSKRKVLLILNIEGAVNHVTPFGIGD
jgi:hypothetical protein